MSEAEMNTIPVLVTAPTSEPLTVEEVKLHLRLDYDNEDSWVAAQITAARQYVEDMAGRQLVTATRKLILDYFTCSVELPRAPLTAVTGITYVDADGVTQTLSTDVYTVDTDSVPGRVYLAYDQSWPDTRAEQKAVEITYTCGYGGPCDVPRGIKSIMLLLIGNWYENREAVVFGQPYSVPFATEALLAQYTIQGAP
jgi:uncharacterized phiE125 gp8 family phage protein